MKVTRLGVLATAGPGNGGTYQYTLAMLQGLQHVSGVEVTVFGDPSNPDFTKLGYPIRAFSENYARQVASLALYRVRLKLPDPFASQDMLLAPIYSLTLLHTNKPFAYTLHDLQELHFPKNFSPRQRLWRRQLHVALLRRAGRVICESTYVKSDIMTAFGVPDERIAVIPAPPQQQFQSALSERQIRAIRDRLRLPDKFIVYPAHYWRHKNHIRLFEALRMVADEEPELKLVLTGNAAPVSGSNVLRQPNRINESEVVGAVDRLQLNNRVYHLGFVDREELQAIYQLAVALVMPSLFESISIPIYEAFQAGTPVAASNILAIPEQVGDGGLLFDPNSAQSIKSAILEIIKDPAAAQARAARARERMAAMTPASYGAQLEGLVASMAASHVAARRSSR